VQERYLGRPTYFRQFQRLAEQLSRSGPGRRRSDRASQGTCAARRKTAYLYLLNEKQKWIAAGACRGPERSATALKDENQKDADDRPG